MDYKKLRAFLIKKVVRPVNYKLNLLKEIKIHLIFYVSLLELALLDAKTIMLDLLKENEG